jgi:DNA-directed RNA polymerase specialized sigma24 family protein
MSSGGSVTNWIAQLKAGDRAAVQRLWDRYFAQLVRLARKQLQNVPRREADEEDVALSAFASFCRRAEQGQFPQLQDRDNLWPLLVVITFRKTRDVMRRVLGPNQGGGKVRGDSALVRNADSPETTEGFDQMVGSEPTPEFVTLIAEEFRRLLEILDDEEQRSIAVWKMEGYTNREITAKLGCSLRRVERTLQLIRKIWENEIKP